MMMEQRTRNNLIIYKAENLNNGEVYIGATTCSLEDRLVDHLQKANINDGSYFHRTISTYGADAFVWEQIDTANSIDELAKKEKEYIMRYNSKENGYNCDSGGGFKKTVYQYSVEDGTLINSYDSLESAANAVNANKKQISRACLNVNKTFRNFYWSYEYIEPFLIDLDKRFKEVIQYDLNGNYIMTFKSISKASKKTGCNKTSIAKVCRGERNHAGGFVWRFK